MDILQRMPWAAQDAVFKRLSEIAEVASLDKGAQEVRREPAGLPRHHRGDGGAIYGRLGERRNERCHKDSPQDEGRRYVGRADCQIHWPHRRRDCNIVGITKQNHSDMPQKKSRRPFFCIFSEFETFFPLVKHPFQHFFRI